MDFKKVTGLEEGSNYTLFDTMYHKSRKTSEGYSPDILSLVYKNNDTGKKKLIQIEKPKIEAYLANPDVEIPHPLCDISMDCVKRIDLTYADAPLEIAKIAGKEYTDYYYECLKVRRFRERNNLHKWERIFASDVNIQDFYRIWSLQKLGHKDVKIHKGFLDIEADIYKHDINLNDSTGDAPINAVTIIDSLNRVSYTLLLRDDNNKLIEELENDIPAFIDELHEDFDEEFGEFKYGVKFYDYEIDLIRDIFNIINTIEFDFVEIWNMRFDIRYIMDRISKLTDDSAASIMCHKDFKVKDAYFMLDSRSREVKLRNDQFIISAKTTYIDQMILYAAIRKAKNKPTYKLDAIAESEVGANKLSYSDIGNIATFPHKNYRKFVKYNIKDVLLQDKIERKVNDLDFMFQKSYESGTRFSKTFRETIYLRNLMFLDFFTQGIILGNNHNMDYSSDDSGEEEEREKFEGAVVGRSDLNTRTGVEMFGRQSKHVYNDVVDEDITSMYPTIISTCNVYPSTQIGRVIMDKEKRTNREIIDDLHRYDRGGKCMDDLQVREPLLYCHRWHNLPTAEKVLEGFKDFTKTSDVKLLFKKRKKRKLFTILEK